MPLKESIISFASWARILLFLQLPFCTVYMLYSSNNDSFSSLLLQARNPLFFTSSQEESFSSARRQARKPSLPGFFRKRSFSSVLPHVRDAFLRCILRHEIFSSWLTHKRERLLRTSSWESLFLISFSSVLPQERKASVLYFLRKGKLLFCTSSLKESLSSVLPQGKRAFPPYFFKHEKVFFLASSSKTSSLLHGYLTQRKFSSVFSLLRKASFSSLPCFLIRTCSALLSHGREPFFYILALVDKMFLASFPAMSDPETTL